MIIGLLTLEFHLEGCTSLKERRGRLSGLRQRFGRLPQIAVCEVPGENSRHACWQFLAMAHSRPRVEQLLDPITQAAATEVDATLLDVQMEWL